MKTIHLRVAGLLALVLLLSSVPFAAVSNSATPTAHFIANLGGSTAPAALGFNVFDVSPSNVGNLPRGVRGMVWLGQKCPTRADAGFRSTIDRLSGNPKVYGFYLSDEPHISDCPGGPAALKTRTDYIRSKNSGKYTFIVLSKQADMTPFRPAVTGVHLVGLDPYPCSIANPQCDLTKIGQRVRWADAAGIPRSRLVPTFQCFGQNNISGGYYRLPTATQLRAMLAEWAKYLPHPVMDYCYSWGNQSSSNPTLVNSPALQRVMAVHNAV